MSGCDPYVLRQVSYQASLLVGTTDFKIQDWEDLRQELILDFLHRSPKFDPARGNWQGFVRGVVRNHATVLFTRRHRSAQREVLVEDLWLGTADDLVDSLRAGNHRIEAELHLSLDVQRVLNSLPPALQEVALLLGELSVIEVCARTRKSRSRIYQMTRQLRDAFDQAGFRPRRSRKSAVDR